MHKFRVSRFFFFFFSIVILTVASLLFFSSSISPILSSFSNEALGRIDYIISKPFNYLNSRVNSLKNLSNASSDNKLLKERLVRLESDNLVLKNLKKENSELKKILDSDLKSPFNIVSQVTVRTPQSWSDSLVISKGENDDLKENMLVTSGSNLIGRVSKLNKTTSHIDLLTCGKTFNLAIKIVDKKKIIYGNLKNYNQEKSIMNSSEFNSMESISLGAKVYTSGLDGESVSDIPIGQVVGITESSDKLKRQFAIKLSADFSTINYVSILGKN